MRKLILFIVLFINLFFISINVYANEDLKNLKVNKKDVVCAGYECSIEIDGGQAEITYEAGENVKSVTPSSGHVVTFENDYAIPFEVTYQDDTTANYTLTIKKHVKSSDNSLSELMINEEKIELKKEVFVYSYDAKFNDEVIILKGKTNDSLATCKDVEYDFSLEKSSLRIEYPVTAEDGTIKNYVITLKRKNKPDTTLKSLTLSGIELEFKPNVLDYEVSVPYSVNKTEISAITNSQDAVIDVSMKDSFVVGENFIEIKVTNKEAFDTYVIKINRLDKVDENLANLEKLKIKDYDLKFNSLVLDYELYFEEIPTSLKIDYKTVSEDAKVEIENNENLEDGSIISIKVSLENGLTKVYKLTINKIEIVNNGVNKTLVIVLIIILVIIMIILFIFQMKEKKHKLKKRKKKVKKVVEEEIEVI